MILPKAQWLKSLYLQLIPFLLVWLFISVPLLLIVPRIDLTEKPAHELMMMFEYSPRIGENLKLYSRIQVMDNYTGSKHNRGYSHFRLGVHLKRVQLGVAAGFESYGNKYVFKNNYGLFLRTEI